VGAGGKFPVIESGIDDTERFARNSKVAWRLVLSCWFPITFAYSFAIDRDFYNHVMTFAPRVSMGRPFLEQFSDVQVSNPHG
jgi:hypothetical protein